MRAKISLCKLGEIRNGTVMVKPLASAAGHQIALLTTCRNPKPIQDPNHIRNANPTLISSNLPLQVDHVPSRENELVKKRLRQNRPFLLDQELKFFMTLKLFKTPAARTAPIARARLARSAVPGFEERRDLKEAKEK